MKWLENMVLQSKLMMLAGFMMAALMLLGYMSYKNLTQWDESVNALGNDTLPCIVGIMDMRVGINQIVIQQNRVRGLQGDSGMGSKLQDALDRMNKGFERYEKGAKVYGSLPRESDEAAEWKNFEENFAKWKDLSLKFQANTLVPLSTNTNPAMEEAYFNQMKTFIEASRAPRTAALESMDKIAQMNVDGGDETVKASQAVTSSAMVFSMSVVAISIAVATLLAILIIRSVTRAITASVTSIRDGAMQITSASDQVASSSVVIGTRGKSSRQAVSKK